MTTQDMTAINYSDLAVQAMSAGDYLQASILWEKAGWESRGKQKRDFYFAKAQACKERYSIGKIEESLETGSGNRPDLCDNQKPAWACA